MDCFGTYFTHAQTCDNVRVQSATQWTASVHTLHMPESVITFVFKVLRNGLLRYILYTCPNLWQLSCSKCYAMDCFGTYSTHAQTCDNVRVQSATQWTASVHTLHMPKPAWSPLWYKKMCTTLFCVFVGFLLELGSWKKCVRDKFGSHAPAVFRHILAPHHKCWSRSTAVFACKSTQLDCAWFFPLWD